MTDTTITKSGKYLFFVNLCFHIVVGLLDIKIKIIDVTDFVKNLDSKENQKKNIEILF